MKPLSPGEVVEVGVLGKYKEFPLLLKLLTDETALLGQILLPVLSRLSIIQVELPDTAGFIPTSWIPFRAYRG